MSELTLQGVRIVEQGTPQGPLIYKTEALWYPTPGWRTELTTYDLDAARAKAHALMEGLDCREGSRVVWAWNSNGHVSE